MVVDEKTKPQDLGRPGHIFPLRAKEGGVLRRTGHTEAAIDLARLAGLKPVGILVEILNEDGTMARLSQLIEVAKEHDLKLISIEDLVAYRMEHDSLINKCEDFTINTKFGSYRLRAYRQTTNDQIHIALTKGKWSDNEPVLVRVNSTLVNNDILGTLTNDVGKKLDDMFKVFNKEGKGAIVFINQQYQSYNLLTRLKHLKESQSKDKVAKAPRIPMDNKDIGIGAQILHDLNIHKIRLVSNSVQTKRVGMIGYGLEITEYVSY
jgi:3,4-dihydroxy 2-butanone 4-phosphate synthase/GTP cyclohydrolase II